RVARPWPVVLLVAAAAIAGVLNFDHYHSHCTDLLVSQSICTPQSVTRFHPAGLVRGTMTSQVIAGTPRPAYPSPTMTAPHRATGGRRGGRVRRWKPCSSKRSARRRRLLSSSSVVPSSGAGSAAGRTAGAVFSGHRPDPWGGRKAGV